jgi:hypothetical protein
MYVICGKEANSLDLDLDQMAWIAAIVKKSVARVNMTIKLQQQTGIYSIVIIAGINK